jgi:hypothetical protein
MATPTLYDPSTETTPLAHMTFPNAINGYTTGNDTLGAVFNPQMPFSIGCVLAGVVTNTTGQGQIYPTGRD